MYVLIPFTASSAESFFTYQGSSPHYEENSKWGNLPPVDFHANDTSASSGAKAIFKPNSTYPFTVGDDFSLGISFYLDSSLIAIDIPPWGATQTVILTFFGHTAETVDETMREYRTGSTLTINYHFVVQIEIPSDMYVSSNTYPSPVEYYVRGNVRWVMFLPDFIEGRYAQSISCSFNNPNSQKLTDILIFLGGIFVAIGGSFFAEPIKNRIERREEKKSENKEAKSKVSRVKANEPCKNKSYQ